MTREEFQYWTHTIDAAQLILKSIDENHPHYSPSGLQPDPKAIAQHDRRAAELLQKARAAHDELAAYLRSRTADSLGRLGRS